MAEDAAVEVIKGGDGEDIDKEYGGQLHDEKDPFQGMMPFAPFML